MRVRSNPQTQAWMLPALIILVTASFAALPAVLRALRIDSVAMLRAD
jgi:hypothetical protein